VRRKRGKKVLLVDYEPDITMAISIVLSTNGFEIYSFNYPILALSNFRPNL
jgi:two-component system, OmpR family, response regulator ChvI